MLYKRAKKLSILNVNTIQKSTGTFLNFRFIDIVKTSVYLKKQITFGNVGDDPLEKYCIVIF